MPNAEGRMPDLSEWERYSAEARDILGRAEDTLRRLEQNGACEGHRMMANQALTALRHLDRIIERHRRRIACEALQDADIQPVPRKRGWLLFLRQRGWSGARPVTTSS
jgi:hypothetical protein